MINPFAKDGSHASKEYALKKLPCKQIFLFACDVARLVLPIWEEQYPNDNRPRTAIETADLFVYGQATMDQLEKARSAVNVTNTTYHLACAAYAAYHAVNTAIYSEYAAYNAINAVYSACNSDVSLYPTIQTFYHQTKQIAIPTTPILQAIAHNIRITRNFQEYNILLDNLEECHNIQLERTIPLGLSHYVLYHLTNTH